MRDTSTTEWCQECLDKFKWQDFDGKNMCGSITTKNHVQINICLTVGKIDSWNKQLHNVITRCTIKPVVYVCGAWDLANEIKAIAESYQVIFKKENF